MERVGRARGRGWRNKEEQKGVKAFGKGGVGVGVVGEDCEGKTLRETTAFLVNISSNFC